MASGKLKFMNKAKGYGFIEPEDNSKDVVVHICAFEKAGITAINDDIRLSYELVDNKGKQNAEELQAI